MSNKVTNPGRRRIEWRIPACSVWGMKIFACITMLIQTVGIVIVEKGIMKSDSYADAVALSEAMDADSGLMKLGLVGGVMEIIGGLAIPIFIFLLVEGFKNTSSFKRYAIALFITALVAEIPYDYAEYGKLFYLDKQNPLWGMLVALIMLYFIKMLSNAEKMTRIIATAWVIICAVVWVYFMNIDGALVTILLTAVFYLLDNKIGWKIFLGTIVLLLNALGSLVYVTGIFSFYPIVCYNEKRNLKCSKYVFYAIYPLQYLILGIIARVIL